MRKRSSKRMRLRRPHPHEKGWQRGLAQAGESKLKISPSGSTHPQYILWPDVPAQADADGGSDIGAFLGKGNDGDRVAQ